ncbi:hypothetical protein JCM3775_006900 [Rhodotorula graminis]|uniref:Phosducin domain-containing protein n=1 Tax=Rhodotorula graminis (strain WP1) TaxID=578459 RepID=A0A194SBD3_RHOGW|nr:uncharacterized protein RHOBADRAFT_51579 [Rhodotorula graminis WP1]KPV77765.1 hypothetical protein RHOBADRAFT_51579 [Rhodotorula graminis WP1]
MSTDAMEQAFLDGTHPALTRDADAAAVLRSNSPTRSRSPSPAPSSSSRDDNGDDDDGPRFSAVDPDPPTGGTPPPRQAGGGRRGASKNTGVKGVREDYREHLAQQQQQQRQGADAMLAKQTQRKMVISLAADANSRDEADGDDDELAALRRRRLAELQGSAERTGRNGGRTFGHLREVGMEQFVQAVEDEADETAVVVHLYEPELALCALLNSHLAALARVYPATKFVRAQASEVDFMSSDLDADTLPTVLVYRRGELETTWIRFDLDLEGAVLRDGERGRKQVEEMLSNAGAIAGSPHAPSPYASFGSLRGNGRAGAADDDDDEWSAPLPVEASSPF